MNLIIHHNDLDGRCSAAIIRYFYMQFLHEVSPSCIEMDYNLELDLTLLNDVLGKDDTLYIVDFSLKEDVMEKVFAITKNVVWIDHHKTAMERKYSIEIPGIRGNEFAACEYTWKYMCERFEINNPIDVDIPVAVKLISDRDNWNWKFGEETKLFNAGMITVDNDPNSSIWNDVFNSYSEVVKIMGRGTVLCAYQESSWRNSMDNSGFETAFDGHRCFAINLGGIGSEAYGERINNYDLCVDFKFTGKNWIVSLRSTKIDVSEIAKKYGGGGHKGAAGFTLNECPIGLIFKEIKDEQTSE